MATNLGQFIGLLGTPQGSGSLPFVGAQDLNPFAPQLGTPQGSGSLPFVGALDVNGGTQRHIPVHRNRSTSLPKHTQVDRRVRIVPKDKTVLSGDLSPLVPNGGVMFPYTPVMIISRQAEWNPYDLAHTNYRTQTYSKSYVDDITLTAQFTADTENSANLAYASAHFFKTMMQMHFGITDPDRGAPPPVLELYGHGTDVLNGVPVVIKSFTQEYNDGVDMVKVPMADAWVPIVQNFAITLGITHDTLKVRNEFNVNAFKNGNMISRGYL